MFARRSLVSLLLGLVAASAQAAPAAGEGPNASPSQGKASRAKLGKLPFRVVKLLPDTEQALLFDRDRGAHVLVSVGDRVGGYDVTEVDEDHLVVRRDGRELMLVVDPAAPQPSGPIEPAGPEGAPAAAARQLATVLDPYLELLDPYGLGAVREVLAPPDQRASLQGTDVVDPYAPAAPDAGGAKEPKVVVAPPTARPVPPTPAPSTADARDATVDAIRKEPLTIQRRELEAALSDFGKLGQDIGFTRQERGVKLGTIAKGSYFWNLGLRAGDVVTAIDGKPLRGLDDAAAAYARLGSARQLAVDVERAGARGTLRFALK